MENALDNQVVWPSVASFALYICLSETKLSSILYNLFIILLFFFLKLH